MSSEEINKYLTEAMGECWHENTDVQSAHTLCRDCTMSYLTHYWHNYVSKIRNDFFTWEGFGKLWEWATKQEWWDGFVYCADFTKPRFTIKTINPTNFAKAIYEHLKEGE